MTIKIKNIYISHTSNVDNTFYNMQLSREHRRFICYITGEANYTVRVHAQYL